MCQQIIRATFEEKVMTYSESVSLVEQLLEGVPQHIAESVGDCKMISGHWFSQNTAESVSD